MLDFSEKIKGFSADMLINSLEIKLQKQLYKVLTYAFYQREKKYLIRYGEIDPYLIM